jgi:hypothetical protein
MAGGAVAIIGGPGTGSGHCGGHGGFRHAGVISQAVSEKGRTMLVLAGAGKKIRSPEGSIAGNGVWQQPATQTVANNMA